MIFSTEKLARNAALRPWRTVIAGMVIFIIGLVLVATLLGSATTEGQGSFNVDPESVKAQDLLEASGIRDEQRDTEIVVVSHDSLTVDDPRFQDKLNTVHAAIVALGAETVHDPGAVPNPTLLPAEVAERFYSENRRHVSIPVTLAGDLDNVGTTVEPLLKLASAETADGFTVGVAGAAAIGADFREVSKKDLLLGESVGIALALVILMIVFRAVGPVWMPILTAAMSIVLALATVSVLGIFYHEFVFFVTNFVTMIGLAVGIDYTLFIVARFKEERARGYDKVDAIARAGATASRAVLFSGVTVVFALVGMLIVPTSIFFSIALGAIFVVIYTVLLSLIFLPALLSLFGDRVNAWRLPGMRGVHDYDDTEHGFWNWMTRTVLARPALFLVVTFTGLVALAFPLININLGFNGVDTLPDEFRAKRTFDILINEFPAGKGLGDVSTVDVVVTSGAGSAATRDALDRLLALAGQDAAFGLARDYELSDDGSVGLLPLNLSVAGDSEEAIEFVRSLRDGYVPAAGFASEVLIGGVTAFSVDFFDLVNTWTPFVIALVLALSFVLLTVVFRSLVVPVKAIILNLLSVGAAYGLLVLVFQQGIGAQIFGFQQVPIIEAWLPLFLFTVLFGLSMDYEVFLLSRIRERFDQTGDNDESVAFGLRSTAGIITGAALIMVAVFGGFAAGDLVMFQQFGFGLGVAILVDATIIRSILVPSTMKLLGRRNWWLPNFLSWLPDVRVEAGGSQQATPAETTAD